MSTLPSESVETHAAELLADFLQATENGTEAAFIYDATHGLFYARRRRDRHEAFSATVDLIQGLWHRFGTDARRLIRHPIYTTSHLTEMDFGMVKVAAKRIHAGLTLPAKSLKPLPPELRAFPWHDLTPVTASPAAARPYQAAHQERFRGELHGPLNATEIPRPTDHYDDEMAMRFALRLASASPPSLGPRHAADRNIGAILLDVNGSPLAWAANGAGRDRTQHAEVRLLQDWSQRTGRAVPVGACLVTTRKPCKMCAGMLWTASENPLSLRVLFYDDDPGPMARLSVLTADSFERRRACEHPQDRLKILETSFRPETMAT